MTKNSELIYNIIYSSDSHPTAEDIYIKINEKYGRVVLATVYNNLNSLCAAGLIRRISIDGSPDRYDKAIRHDHLICRKCGAIADFYMDDITDLIEKKLGSRIFSYDLKCSYLCPVCRGTSDSSTENTVNSTISCS